MTTVEEIIRGLQIFTKYVRGDINFAAEHDQIWAGPDDISLISAEDNAELETLRWFVDDESESWTRFA